MRYWVWVSGALGALALGVAGCSSGGDPTGGGGRTGSGSNTPAAGGTAGTSGDGSATAAGSSGNDFGNTNVTAPSLPTAGGPANPEDACQDGVFCEALSPDEGCGSLALTPDVEITTQPGNVLIVFDVSGSMAEAWGTTSKIAAASTALMQAMTPLADNLTAGAILFPTVPCVPALPPPMGGAVEPITGPTQIPFQPGAQFLQAWNTRVGPNPAAAGIGTPLNEAFDRAAVALSEATLTGNVAVVVFTDGAPNCPADAALSGVPVSQPEVNWAYDWLTMNGIKTYVVGLPGGQGVQVLNDIAMYGGTDQYIVPDDPAVLEEQLRSIVEETVTQGFDSCSINLDPPAEAPDKLHVVVEEAGNKSDVPRVLGTEDAWNISDDGSHVELLGSFCTAAQGGTYDEIKFEFGCVDLPPLPPIVVD